MLWHYRSQHVAWAIQALPYAAIIYTALRYALPYGLAAVGYILLMLIATWPRFLQVTIPQFFRGIGSLGAPEQLVHDQTEGDLIQDGNGNGGQSWRLN